MTEEISQPVPLRQGQSFIVFVEGGSHIIACCGSIRIEPAAKTSMQGVILLYEGEAQFVESGNWLRLASPSGGQFLLVPPQPIAAAWPIRLMQALLGVRYLPH